MTAIPQPPPESLLIRARREAMDPRPSYRKAARAAGISPERWRQIETGMARVAKGVDVPVTGVPAYTIARMAQAVGATPAELGSCGRPDAAAELARLIEAAPEREMTDAEMLADLRQRLSALEQQMQQPGRVTAEQEEESGDQKNRAV